MSGMTIEEKLDKLAEIRSRVDVLNIEWEEKRAQLLAPIADRLNDLDAEYMPQVEQIEAGANELEAEIKNDVLQVGSTVKGTRLMAVWNKGRDNLDMKGLKGYAVAHPEIVTFWKPGQPTVSLRAVGG